MLDRHGLVQRRRRRRYRAQGTALSRPATPNELWCDDDKGEFMLADRRYCYPLTTVGGEDIHVLSLDREPMSEPFVNGPAREGNPMFSPDRQWLAYMSDESGEREVYLRRYPSGETRTQVSRGGGIYPVWSRDGDELFLFGTDVSRARPIHGLPSVSIATDPDLRIGSPTLVAAVESPGVERLDDVDYVEGRLAPGNNLGVAYDVEPGGERFLMIMSEPTPNDD